VSGLYLVAPLMEHEKRSISFDASHTSLQA